MASFRLPKDAVDFFKELRKNKRFSLQFDIIYFCFIAGIAENKKRPDMKQADLSDVVDEFPISYKSKRSLLVSLLIHRTITSMGIPLSDKKQVNDLLCKLIDPHSKTFMTDEAMKEFNYYVYGGYDVIRKWFSSKPTELSSFLIEYKINLDRILNNPEQSVGAMR